MSLLRALPLCSMAAIAAMALVSVSCGGDKRPSVPDIPDTRLYPTMLTTDVSTFVSDSGYTRYHITAPLWVMYEEADTPHWTFPQGLFMEKYDDDMNPTATFTSDSATYLSQRKIWRFDGNVRMVNTDGDRFATPQLFWDQSRRRVYSDSFMHIERTERIIEGYGFDSNESMTEYTVLNPQMILPIDRMRAERQRRDSTYEAVDSVSTGRAPLKSPTDSQAVSPAVKRPASATVPMRPSSRTGRKVHQFTPGDDGALQHIPNTVKK